MGEIESEFKDNEAERPKPPVIELKDVVLEINSTIPPEISSASTANLEQMHKKLSELPYISAQEVALQFYNLGEDEGVRWVNTNAIVGSISSAFENWSTEYDSRKGRIVNIAEQLIDGMPKSVDNVFHITQPRHGIILKKISAPKGDLIFVIDGSHRVAGCKLAKLPRIPAKVEKLSELKEFETKDPVLKSDWEERIRMGLIEGSIEEISTSSFNKTYILNIESQVLPWMYLPQHTITKFTKLYFDLYPDAHEGLVNLLNNQPIPKEALIDNIAMNYYLANRWDEYTNR